MIITSVQNAKVKQLRLLEQKSGERRQAGLFVVEGLRELMHCMEAGLRIDTLFHCPAILPVLPAAIHADNVIEISPEVYAKIAMREGTEGVVAQVVMPQTRLEDLRLPANPLIIVMESVEKPGNLGAVLRTADAAGVDAVVVCDPLCDLYNPHAIRSSIGASFTVKTVACTSAECIAWLKGHDIQILTAQLQDSSLYYDTPMTGPTALVMGTESTGLTPIWRAAADAHIRIPMLGRLDSLNVSVSAAILTFEAVRQRQINMD